MLKNVAVPSRTIVRHLSLSTSENQSVVVTGLGVVCPLGLGARLAWNRLCEGRTGAVQLTDEKFSKVINYP